MRRDRRRHFPWLSQIVFVAFAPLTCVVAVVLAESDPERRRMSRDGDDTAIPVDPGPIAPSDVRRVSIVGAAGSGKTTLAEEWQNFRGLPYVKVDALQTAETGGGRATPEEFSRRMKDAASQDSWILDGNVDISGVYCVVDETWSRADLVIWLDLPRHVLMRRILVRTTVRALHRTDLGKGSRQHWRDLFVLDPNRSVFAWTWTEQPRLREAYERHVHDPRWSPRIVRLRSPREVRRMARKIRLTDARAPRHEG